MNKTLTLKYHVASIAWASLIVLLSGLPGSNFPHFTFWEKIGIDKLAHAFFYGVLLVLITVGLVKQYRFSSYRKKSLRVAFLITLVFGIIVEMLQEVIFYQRLADPADVMANLVGCLMGVAYFRWNFSECLKASKW